MKAITIITFFVAAASLLTLVSSASIRPRGDSKQNQYPWYYWNQDGQQGYPPYYTRCGAQGIGSLSVLSLCIVGLIALMFAGMPEVSKTQLQRIKY